MLENEKKVNCPRCKGEGIIRGQEIAKGKRLPNYKHVQDGDCFVCNATGKVYLIDGKFIGISHFNKNKLVEYDSKGQCIGPYEYNNSECDEIILFENEMEHKKEELINIEKRYQKVIIKLIHESLNTVFRDYVVDIYNDEEDILNSSVWKNEKETIEEFKKENEKTRLLLDKVLNKKGLSLDKLEKLELFKHYAISRFNRVVLVK